MVPSIESYPYEYTFDYALEDFKCTAREIGLSDGDGCEMFRAWMMSLFAHRVSTIFFLDNTGEVW